MQTSPVPGPGGEKYSVTCGDGLSQVGLCVCVHVREIQLPIRKQGEAPQGLWVRTLSHLSSIIVLP